jgi:hypothetical protein
LKGADVETGVSVFELEDPAGALELLPVEETD